MRFSSGARLCATLSLLSLSLAAHAQESVDMAMMQKIRTEGLRNSQITETLVYLTDVIGPRLTGSPGLLRANEWTKAKLTEWGLVNAKLEPWGPFGRGWTLERFSLQVAGPTAFPVIAFPKAWSTGWRGTAEVVVIDAADDAAMEKYRGQLKGKIVLVSPVRDVPAHFTPQGTRRTDEALAQLSGATPAVAGNGRRGGAPGAPSTADMTPEQRARFQAAMQQRGRVGAILKFAKDEGAVAALDSGRGDGGTVFVQQATLPAVPNPNAGAAPQGRRPAGTGAPQGQQPPAGPRPTGTSVWSKAAEKRMIPQIAVSVEHYNRIVRMAQAGEKVTLALDLKVRFNGDDKSESYNTVAEIPGTDKAEEIVMCGAHLDSWQGGTGATDNAAGSAVCMEAMRILKTLGVKPRRTIRIALWSGEEQGLMGSRAYATRHFGPRDKPTAEHGKFSAYFNLDNGTGKIRGVYCQGNTGVMPIFAEWLKPFADLGATTVTRNNTGGTDHQSFDGVGLPGFQFIQDEIEYDTRTHHSNEDVYDRIQIEDMKQAATIMAAFLYNAAMRDEKLPRKQPIRFD